MRHQAESSLSGNLKLVAVDLDGTLLGTDGKISAANRRAVARLHEAGLEVALASGRHYESILPLARQLPEVRWIISAQGGEVSQADRSVVLQRTFLLPPELAFVLELSREFGLGTVAYTPDGIRTATEDDEGPKFYTQISGLRPTRVSYQKLMELDVHKVVGIGTLADPDHLRSHQGVVAHDLQVMQAHPRLFELMPRRVNKGSALGTLAAHLGLTAAQTVALGDADNDIPMFGWAATSFAMAHGSVGARERASQVAPAGDANEAVARVVDVILSRRVDHDAAPGPLV